MADVLNPAVWNEIDNNNNSAFQPSFPEFMPAANVNNASRAIMGAIKRWADQINATATSTGGPTNYVLTYAANPDALYNGQRFIWVPNIDSAVSPNLNVNLLGNKRIRKVAGGAAVELVAGDIQAGFPVEVVYNLSGDQWIFLNPPLSVANASETVYGTVQFATTSEMYESLAGDALLAANIKNISSLWEIGANIAGAPIITMPAGGMFHITGAVWTCTALAWTSTSSPGRRAVLVFNSSGGILTHGPNLLLPGSKNITVKAGDVALFVWDTGSIFRCISYQSGSIPAPFTDFKITALGSGTQQITQVHGLSTAPSFVLLLLECTAIDDSYAVGDRIYTMGTGSKTDAPYGMVVSAGAVNVDVSIHSGVFVPTKTGSAMSPLTLANWDLIIRVYA